MADESSDREKQIRHAASVAVGWLGVGEKWRHEATTALTRALMLVDARPGVATGERDERTADLEALTQERDAALLDKDTAVVARAAALDKRDAAEWRAKQAEAELRKAYALIDELRAQLAAPTVQSAAIKAWLALPDEERTDVTDLLRDPPTPLKKWDVAADVLGSLSMQASAPKVARYVCDEYGMPVGASEEIERLNAHVSSLQACNDNQRVTIKDLQSRLKHIEIQARLNQ